MFYCRFYFTCDRSWMSSFEVWRTVVVSTVCVRDVCECALIRVPKSTTSSVSSDDFSTTFGAVRVKCRDWVRTVADVASDGHCDGYNTSKQHTALRPGNAHCIRDVRSFKIRFEFESAVRFERDWQIWKLSNRIGRACPFARCKVSRLVKRLKPLTALSGTVYRLASSVSDHTPVV